MGACLAGTLGKHRGANVNQVQFGDKLQGLPPATGVRRPSKIYRTKAGGHLPNRDKIYCINQLGSIGNVKNSQFASNADGVMVKPYCNQIYDKRVRGKRGVPQHHRHPGEIGVYIASAGQCHDTDGVARPGRCANMANCFVRDLHWLYEPSATLSLGAHGEATWSSLGSVGREPYPAVWASLQRAANPLYGELELRKCSYGGDYLQPACSLTGYFSMHIRFLIEDQGPHWAGTVVSASFGDNVHCDGTPGATQHGCSVSAAAGGLGGTVSNKVSITGFLGTTPQDPDNANWMGWLLHWIGHQVNRTPPCSGDPV